VLIDKLTNLCNIHGQKYIIAVGFPMVILFKNGTYILPLSYKQKKRVI